MTQPKHRCMTLSHTGDCVFNEPTVKDKERSLNQLLACSQVDREVGAEE